MIKNLIKKPLVLFVGLILIFGLIYSAAAIFKKNNKASDELEAAKEVKTVNLELNGGDNGKIEAVGTIKAKTKIAVVSLAKGTARNVFFSVGDAVFSGQTLVSLSDSLTLSNLIGAETNYANMLNNRTAAKRLADETVRQAELGVQAALDSVEAAEIGLANASGNLDNYLSLREKTNEDVKINAVTSYSGYLNSVFNALDQIDLIIRADDAELQPGFILLDPSIGAKDLDSLPAARLAYKQAKSAYLSAKNTAPNTATIHDGLDAVIDAMEKTRIAIDAMVDLLDNTVTGLDLTTAWLNAQKTNFINLRSSLVASINAAKSTKQAIENIGLVDTRDESSLNNAVLAAKNRLSTAKINYQNSLVALENAKQGARQQEISAQTALDSAQNQLNLANIQAGDLTVRAPIEGQITAKMIEPGMEISPGMKIAEISQTDRLTIETDINSEDSGKIYLGQEVKLIAAQGERTGIIAKIFPAADPISKKVRVEIDCDNRDNALIPETFIDIAIPLQGDSEADKKLFIPLQAVTITANETYVFVVKEDRAKKTAVEIGEAKGASVEIISGLDDKDELIIEGAKLVSDNDKVMIVE